jgi:hypothetical protein
MMPLATPNNPDWMTPVLSALRVVLPQNTLLAQNSPDSTGQSLIYPEADYLLSAGAYPAVLLYCTPLTYKPCSRSTYSGTFDAVVVYYQRWDKATQSGQMLDLLWQSVALDLARMQANVESNDRLVVGYTNYLQTITKIALSPYYGPVTPLSPALYTLSRSMTLSCVLPPFDS